MQVFSLLILDSDDPMSPGVDVFRDRNEATSALTAEYESYNKAGADVDEIDEDSFSIEWEDRQIAGSVTTHEI